MVKLKGFSFLSIVCFVCVAFFNTQSYAQIVELPAEWKFMAGDDKAYKEAGFDDSQWQTIKVNAVWERPAIAAEKSYGWYRVAFDLPAAQQGKNLQLLLGTIDDADETYLNGVLIGHTGKMPPNDETAWETQRKYLAKKELLKAHNVLAIKVYNGAGIGGMLAGSGVYNPNLCYMAATDYQALMKTFMKDKKSYHQLTTSNGLIAAVYNAITDKIENVYPHIFSYYDSAKPVQPFVQNIHLVNAPKPLSAKYLQNTHVIEVQYPNFVVDYVAPFSTEEKIFYAVVKGNPLAIKYVSFVSEKVNAELISNETTGIDLGSEKYFVFSFSDSLENNNEQINIAVERIRNGNHHLINEEVKFMRGVMAKCKLPVGINPAEKKLAEQSISVLKMSQVSDKEIFPLSHGQILASLKPGVWAISWVRDASYAIQAMSRIGMYEEAKKGLSFMLNAAPTDQYVHYIHKDGKDYGIGVPYQISVTRYFGNGREESDYDERGPNIEIDDFGLFLTAFADYVNRAKDEAFYRQWNNVVINKVVAAIIHTITSNNLIKQDSGPWEHHLPGRQFIFTNAVCAKGLQEIALLQKKYGLPSASIDAALAQLLKGINDNYLIDGKFYKGNALESNSTDHYYFDGATFEIFANGLIDSKSVFISHMQQYDKILRASHDPKKGYIRFNSQDSYENQEWPFASLRVAIAQNKFGNRVEAKQLIDRITLFASKNYNVVPEILSLDFGIYKGAIPMVGYGSGAYLLSLLDYYQK